MDRNETTTILPRFLDVKRVQNGYRIFQIIDHVLLIDAVVVLQ